ncbi:MAG: ImmA/IrrE family metallo-endopeptidase [Ktedonobacterales bacterium]
MINGARVRQARELNRLTQAELAHEVGVAQTTIAHIESARFQPAPELVRSLSMRLGVPETFFERIDPPQFPDGSLRFRGHADLALVDKREAQRIVEVVFEASALMAKRVRNKITLSIPQLSEEPMGAAEAARFARGVLGLSPDAPIPNVIRLLEQSGVLVFALPVRLEGRDAYSCWMGATTLWTATQVRRPVIVLSGGVPTDRLRFSAAHELGHLVMHQVVHGTSKELEEEANTFAAEFLMPEDSIREEIVPPVTLTELAALKMRWRVSIQALVARAYELNIISKRQYNYLHEQLRARNWKTQEPVVLSPEKPRALRRMAEVVYGDPIDVPLFARDLDQFPHFVKRMVDCYATKEEYTARTTTGTPSADDLPPSPGSLDDAGNLVTFNKRF